MTKKPAKKPHDPKETKVQLNNLLHSIATLNQTTNALEIIARQVKRAQDLLHRDDAGISDWSNFLAENHGKEALLNTIQANVDNAKLSDTEFRLFVSNSLKG